MTVTPENEIVCFCGERIQATVKRFYNLVGNEWILQEDIGEETMIYCQEDHTIAEDFEGLPTDIELLDLLEKAAPDCGYNRCAVCGKWYDLSDPSNGRKYCHRCNNSL